MTRRWRVHAQFELRDSGRLERMHMSNEIKRLTARCNLGRCESVNIHYVAGSVDFGVR